jgi:hypothetical protein
MTTAQNCECRNIKAHGFAGRSVALTKELYLRPSTFPDLPLLRIFSFVPLRLASRHSLGYASPTLPFANNSIAICVDKPAEGDNLFTFAKSLDLNATNTKETTSTWLSYCSPLCLLCLISMHLACKKFPRSEAGVLHKAALWAAVLRAYRCCKERCNRMLHC